MVLALLALIGGQLVRALVPGTAALFLGSLVALAGIAVGNVLLPGLIRLHFPDRIPVGFGVLFDVSGGWTVPLVVLCLVVLAQAVAGCLAVRPRFVEDELPVR